MDKFNNLLNLKKKDPSDIVVVEKIVLKNRNVFFEVFRMLTIMAIASGILWGASNADNLVGDISNLTSQENITPQKSITGIYGTVSLIDNGILYLDDSSGSKYEGVDVFNIDLSTVKRVETNDDTPKQLSISDIKVLVNNFKGNKVVVH